MSKLNDVIDVSVRFQRSTRIDHDLDRDGSFFDGFVFHGTAEHTLNSIANNFAQAKRKAFTVTGPYGSGKSTVALLMAGMLSTHEPLRDIAREKTNTDFCHSFKKKIPVKKGWFVVKAVSDFEDPIETLWRAIKAEAKEQQLDLSSVEEPIDSKSFIKSYKKVAKLTAARFDGILILLDEMGKTLEYLNSKHRDLQFYQELAETVERFHIPTLFIGFLHQAFAEYAKAQNQSDRDGWAKVQGRYTDLLFNVSEDETISLLSTCLKQSNSYKADSVLVKQVLAAIPPTFVEKRFNLKEKLTKCLPLHPLTAMLLGPISKRRFSQNERSTFSFLSSAESKAFQEFIKINADSSLYRLSDLYDYLEANLDHLISFSPDARIWSEAKYAIERAEIKFGYDEKITKLIKTIALLNLFGRRTGIFATKKVLQVALIQEEESLDQCLESLINEKIVIFRRHLNAYAVFEGTDVDLDEEIEKKLADFSGDEWQTTLHGYSEQIVAKRHYHEKGVLRWMNIVVHSGNFDPAQLRRKHKINTNAFSAFVLVTDEDAKALSIQYPDYVFGSSGGIFDLLKKLILEQKAIEHLGKHHEKLLGDKIAQKEIEDRLASVRLQIESLYSRLFSQAQWYSDGEMYSGVTLSEIVSSRADKVFDRTVPLLNELINRTKPSATVVAARNKLMSAMIDSYFNEDLGIDGYPPEMAMYQSCIKHKGLHQYDLEGGEYRFVWPDKEDYPELYCLWEFSLSFIKQNKYRQITLYELVRIWNQAPYGITEGLIPIWLLSFLLSNLDNLAFYDQDVTNKFIYITEPDEEFINKLVRNPDKVAIRYFDIDGVKTSHFNSLSRILNNNSNTNNTTLTVSQEFVRFVSRLSPYVKSTKRISNEAFQFREIALRADDPNKFVLEDMPAMFGDQPDIMIERLKQVVDELKGFLTQELKLFRKEIEDAVGTANQELYQTALSVHSYSSESSLKTFALRLSEFSSVDSEVWVKNMLSFLSGTAERNWTDKSFTKAKSELVRYAERFKQARYFATYTGAEVKRLEKKDHKHELQQIDALLNGLSQAEQAVVLRKKLESLMGE